MKNRIIFFFLLNCLVLPSFAQGVYDDFIYTRQAVTERKVIPWPYLREADVMFAKRVWRIIDTREKANQPMVWPNNPLNLIFYNAVMDGKLTAYKNDSLSSVFTTEEYKEYFKDKKPDKKLIDPNGDPEDPTNFYMDTINIILEPSNVQKFKVVEDWIFDKKESRMYVRIIAIAPVVKPNVGGVDLGEVEWGWLKYHRDSNDPDKLDVRELLVNMEVFNRQNDAARLTFDDWFEMRMFSSYITKEANQYDLPINSFAEFKDDGTAALLESDRIKQDLFEKEHDLWEY